MKPRAKLFSFESYHLNKESKQLELNYSVDKTYHFTERWGFDFEWVDELNHEALDRALFMLHILAGVSYYKAHLAAEIEVLSGELDVKSAELFADLYQKGLGQFFYTNQLDPFTPIPFRANSATAKPAVALSGLDGVLLPIGGGKDSLVSAEALLGSGKAFTSWVINHSTRFYGMLHQFGMPHIGVSRKVDPRITEHNTAGAYNGHVPITAIVLAAAIVSAILAGKKTVLFSNESSTDEGNVEYRGAQINHQYSKSLVVERQLADYIKNYISPDLEYFSLLRPLTELAIGQKLSRVFDKYRDVFSSCNQNYLLGGTDQLYWCGRCSKCAFVFLILSPFVPKSKLEALFAGQNLFTTPELHDTFEELLGIKGFKPFECVGEIAENRYAARLAYETGDYPELEGYGVADAQEYEWQSLRPHRLSDKWLKVISKSA